MLLQQQSHCWYSFSHLVECLSYQKSLPPLPSSFEAAAVRDEAVEKVTVVKEFSKNVKRGCKFFVHNFAGILRSRIDS